MRGIYISSLFFYDFVLLYESMSILNWDLLGFNVTALVYSFSKRTLFRLDYSYSYFLYCSRMYFFSRLLALDI